MAGEFFLNDSGLSPLSEVHTQVAGGLSQLTDAAAPQAADVAQSFGNIAFSVNNALDGVLQSRGGTIDTTKVSSQTIGDLLAQAQQMYAKGDMAGADKLTAAAEALREGGPGASAGPVAAGAGASGVQGAGSTAGAQGAGGAAGAGQAGGGDMAGQMASQLAQAMTQTVAGIAQGLSQLPQQVMQGVQGIVQTATGAAGGAGGSGNDEKSDKNDKPPTGSVQDDKPATDAKDEKDGDTRDAPTSASSGAVDAQQGAGSTAGRAPVEPAPAQTRPQQSPR